AAAARPAAAAPLPTPRQPNWPTRPRVLLIGNVRAASRRREIVAAIAELERYLREEAHAEVVGVDANCQLDLSALQSDLVLNVDGDGSLLSVVRRMRDNQNPVGGINFGKFGFLAEFEYEDFWDDLAAILDGRFAVRERWLIGGRLLRDGTPIADTYA